MQVLVTGAAGYIGSHLTKAFFEAGHLVSALDSLERGKRSAVKWGTFYQCDLRDASATQHVLAQSKPEIIVHAAAYAYVGESVLEEKKYWDNNVVGTENLLRAAAEIGCRHIIFSSSCSVYGNSDQVPIPETAALKPLNPYAATKKRCEELIEEFCTNHYSRATILRFFNVAGSDPEMEIGEDHDPETHIIPLLIRAAIGSGTEVQIFGDDYPTPDGSCIRDYVHVTDLAEAHVAACNRPASLGSCSVYNVGTGRGYSVLQIVAELEKITGAKIPHRIVGRRPGDPAILVADAAKVQRELRWRPKYSELKLILDTALKWEKRRGNKDSA